MDVSALAGNPRLKELLSQREEGRGLSHAYLISGPAGSGRHTLARLLAQAMLCQGAHKPCGQCGPCKKVAAGIHPDVIVASGDGDKPISVDQVRSLRADAYVRPNEGERKIYLLEGADRMNAAAQNAMLKLLEEGPEYAAFLLLAENAGAVLQTVRSRCEELSLTPVNPKEALAWLEGRFPGKSREELQKAALDCQGLLGRAVEALEGGGEASRERSALAARLCDTLAGTDEAALFEASMVLDKLGKEELPRFLDELEAQLGARAARGGDRKRLLRGVELVRTLRGAARLNANPGQLAGWLCAGMFCPD